MKRGREGASPPEGGGEEVVNLDFRKGADVGNEIKQRREVENSSGGAPVVATEKEKSNFGLSGALAKDAKTGNMVSGVLMKWSEPPDAAMPSAQWRFYVFKFDKLLQTMHIHRKSAFLVGRDDRVADILLDHQSCSKQHAVVQFRLVTTTCRETGKVSRVVKPYLMDLGSSNKTFLNDVQVEDARYIELREKDVVKFGASSREYVLMKGE